MFCNLEGVNWKKKKGKEINNLLRMNFICLEFFYFFFLNPSKTGFFFI
jgi:hypothetical protein